MSTRAEEGAARASLWKGRAVSISILSGGLTNENYLVECDGRRYVMRLPGQSTELLAIDRANEVFNTKAAATTGIGPQVLEHVAGADVMVLEFIPGTTMSAGALPSDRMAARMALAPPPPPGPPPSPRHLHVPARRGVTAERPRSPG